MIPDGVGLLGKELDNLQANVTVGAQSIGGTLKYVEGYTGFSGKVEEQSGHYLALHISTEGVSGATITVSISDSTNAPVTLDEDETIVIRVKSTRQKITVTASKEGYPTNVRVLELSGLTLADAN